jgi:transcriptional regulator with XRE-family HTH domain
MNIKEANYCLMLGQCLKAWRQYRGFSIAHLTRLSEISREQVNRMETGERNFSFLYAVRICEALGITIQQLTDLEFPSDIQDAP